MKKKTGGLTGQGLTEVLVDIQVQLSGGQLYVFPGAPGEY